MQQRKILLYVDRIMGRNASQQILSGRQVVPVYSAFSVRPVLRHHQQQLHCMIFPVEAPVLNLYAF